MNTVQTTHQIINRATADAIDLCVKTLGPLKIALGISNKEIFEFANRVILTFLPDVTRYALSDPAKHDSVDFAYDTTCCKAVLCHRIANAMLGWEALGDEIRRQGMAYKVYEEAKLMTGIDIHPGAQIGPGFVIDHGVNTKIMGSFRSGAVIGETTIIGENVTILNGVLLGAREVNIGNAYTERRHPKIGNNVTICGNVQILGGIEVGDGAFIGPGCIITQNVPAGMHCTTKTTIQMTKLSDKKSPELYAVVMEEGHLAVHGHKISKCSLSFLDEYHQSYSGYVANILDKCPDKIVFDISVLCDANAAVGNVQYLCVSTEDNQTIITSDAFKRYLSTLRIKA